MCHTHAPILVKPCGVPHVGNTINKQPQNLYSKCFYIFRACAGVLNMWSCRVKLAEEKSKHASLTQRNCTLLVQECNKCDVTVA
jgi:hypothetical protein